MNQRQLGILWVSILIFTGLTLWVPWVSTFDAKGIRSTEPKGYGFIFAPPLEHVAYDYEGLRIDGVRLVLEYALLIVPATALIITLGQRTKTAATSSDAQVGVRLRKNPSLVLLGLLTTREVSWITLILGSLAAMTLHEYLGWFVFAFGLLGVKAFLMLRIRDYRMQYSAPYRRVAQQLLAEGQFRTEHERGILHAIGERAVLSDIEGVPMSLAVLDVLFTLVLFCAGIYALAGPLS